MREPIVSVVIPCYKQGQFLEEAINSVLSQSFQNWECVIVNDGSDDETEEIGQKITIKDSRFKYFYQKNQGLSSARNKGISQSKGEFILPLDADDTINADYLKLALEIFEEDPELKVVYCKALKFGIVNGIWDLGHFSLENLARHNIIFCSALYRKSDWEKINGYDINMHSGLEDWEFWISLLKTGGRVKQLDYFGFNYRVRRESMLRNLNLTLEEEMRKYMTRKHIDFLLEKHGSIFLLLDELEKKEKDFQVKMNSEKFILDLILKKIFGWTVFKNIN